MKQFNNALIFLFLLTSTIASSAAEQKRVSQHKKYATILNGEDKNSDTSIQNKNINLKTVCYYFDCYSQDPDSKKHCTTPCDEIINHSSSDSNEAK